MSSGYNSENKFFYEAPSIYRKSYFKNNNNVILSSRENIIKSKCYRTLIKKLKKYKLRRDGVEDPDVLDISKTFHLSLKLKSPNKDNKHESFDDLKVTNYLFKMVPHNKTNIKISNTEAATNGDDFNVDKDSEIMMVQNGTISSSSKNTNAFDLMMSSRNKSIGTNSPGKDRKCDDDDDKSYEKDIRKAAKIKQSLYLQKMAEAKGCLEKKELEDYKDKCIKKKMDDRANRLKGMLTKGRKRKKKNGKPCSETTVDKSNLEVDKRSKLSLNNKEIHKKDLQTIEKPNTHKIMSLVDIDMFNTTKSIVNNISKEDEDFLNKLSPSLKNRDMLCYFKKVDKVLPLNITEEDNIHVDSSDNEINENLIKVKIISSNKKKRKKKHSLKKKKLICEDISATTNMTEGNEDINTNNIIDNNKLETELLTPDTLTRKRKRINLEDEKSEDKTILNNCEVNKQNRPKRNNKQPVKYDLQSSNSDEELLDFLPRKKRSLRTSKCSLNKEIRASKKIPKTKDVKEIIVVDSEDEQKEKKSNKTKTGHKKSAKMAPLFMPRPQIDPAALEAKQKFLQSGVPEQLRKIHSHSKKQVSDNHFFVTKHVQQFASAEPISKRQLKYNYDDSDEDDIDLNIFDSKSILNREVEKKQKSLPGFKNGVKSCLQMIKLSYPEFPVYRTYKLLRNKYNKDNTIKADHDNSLEAISEVNLDSKTDDPSHLSWTEKYRVQLATDIIGNFEGIKELKGWLQTWRDNEASSKKKQCNSDSDSSDFCYNYDTDSRDSMRGVDNLLIITGPVGCGKTTSVYAVAAELSIKVIEVNVSSKRTGKIILQDLQEATQSHKVNRTKSAENSQNLQEIKKYKNTKKKNVPMLISKTKKFKTDSEIQTTTYSQELNKTEMSLVMIDDADIVFDQDDGFVSAISQIIQCSKRPIILVTSSLSCQHLQKFLHCGNIVKMQPLKPRMLGTWLDIMCLSDVGLCWPGYGARCLDVYKGDIRKAINYMQYLFSSQANMDTNKNYSTCIDLKNKDCIVPWIDKSDTEETQQHTSINFTNYESTESLYSKNTSTIWWNISKLMSNSKESEGDLNSKDNHKKLSRIFDVIDCLSLTDILTKHKQPNCILSDPWETVETDGVQEGDNFTEYNNYTGYNNDATHSMIQSSLLQAQSSFDNNDIDMCLPETSIRRARSQILETHHTLSDSFSNCAILDRRALATDYWPACRTICRIERDKVDNNSKRRNRFCHYLRSMKVACKNNSFDVLCSSLETKHANDAK